MIALIKKRESIIVFFVACIITSIFFYKTILFHQVPFPGDLLVDIMPYNTQSFNGFVPGTFPNKAQDRDVITQLYPWKFFTIQELKKGRIPFWNPHTFAGNPQMQDYQTGVFYPLNIIFLIFPFPVAWSIYIMSQSFLALIFMYIFLREENISWPGRWIGSIAFAFSSYIVVWIEYGNIGSTWLWLPLSLVAIKKCFSTFTIRWYFLLVVSLTIAFFAGYIQGIFYIYLIAVIYAFWQYYTNKDLISRRQIIAVFLGFVFPLIIASIQIFPTMDVFRQSTRNNYSFSQLQFLLNPWYSLVTVFAPDFFGNPVNRNMTVPLTYIERVMYPGVVILFFSFIGVTFSKRKEKWLWCILGGVVALCTTNFWGIAHIYQLPVPILSTTVPTRALSVLQFCFIMLGVYGIDTWTKTDQLKRRWIIPLIFLLLVSIIWLTVLLLPIFVPVSKEILSVAKRNLILPTILLALIVFFFFIKKIAANIVYFLLLLLIVIDLLYFFQKITPFAPAAFIYPSTPVISFLQQHEGIDRFWGYGEASISPGLQSVDSTYLPDGIDALHLKTYGDLLAASKTGTIPQDVPRMEANVAPGYGVSDLSSNPYRQKLLDITGTKYILHKHPTSLPDNQTFPSSAYHLVWQKGMLQMYENLSSLPRIFLISQYETIPDEKNAIERFYSPSFNPSSTVILSEKPYLEPTPGSKGTVILKKYTSQNIQMKTSTNGSMILFLSDAYTPDWYAHIDGKSTPVYVSDGAFRAIVVPKGTHTVSFTYYSKLFMLGLLSSVVGIIGVIISSFFLIIYGKQK